MAQRTIGRVTTAAGTGTGVGGAAAIVLVWVLGLFGLEVPNEVAGAIVLLLGAAGTIVGGWLVPSPGGGEHRAT